MRAPPRHDLLGPVVVALVVYLAALGVQLRSYGGDPTGFVQFGSEAAVTIRPPTDAYVQAGTIGYDGQFYYVLALAPQIDSRAADVFEPFEYRAQRIAYPALSWLVAGGGSERRVPWALLVVNLVFALIATAAAAAWLRDKGRSGWLALAVGLSPGVLMTLLRDLTDVVGLAAALVALWAWSQSRERLTSLALVLAVLARETMLVLVAAVAYDAWRRRRDGGRTTALVPLVLPALVCFAAWQAYATWRFGGDIPWTTAPSGLWDGPVIGAVGAIPGLSDQPAREVAWDLAYLAICGVAVAAAGVALRRTREPETLFCASQAAIVVLLGEVFWIDHWSFTRVTAPLFASLLLAGVVARSRLAVLTACSAAAFTVLIPAALNTHSGLEPRGQASRPPVLVANSAASRPLAEPPRRPSDHTASHAESSLWPDAGAVGGADPLRGRAAVCGRPTIATMGRARAQMVAGHPAVWPDCRPVENTILEEVNPHDEEPVLQAASRLVDGQLPYLSFCDYGSRQDAGGPTHRCDARHSPNPHRPGSPMRSRPLRWWRSGRQAVDQDESPVSSEGARLQRRSRTARRSTIFGSR
jgi:hypothetical protein